STVTWIAMLFSAGMGIGLVFYGAAEPLSHYAISPATADPNTAAAFKEGLRQSFFHWGFHVWAMYAIVALSLAFFQFRKGEPGLISATLKPIFGKKMEGPWGIFVDVLAVFATTFGVATSLGFGAVQINAGLNYLFGIEIGIFPQLIIIAIVTVLFVISAWSGLSRGI
ncbi:BCCT family transporter, partial [Microvirga sp. 3-52]|nr:BCCT family transporter [Microvirga sp. 3-52]